MLLIPALSPLSSTSREIAHTISVFSYSSPTISSCHAISFIRILSLLPHIQSEIKPGTAKLKTEF